MASKPARGSWLRWLRPLRTVAMYLLMGGGLTLLLMWLAGAFRAKVPDEGPVASAAAPEGAVAEVQLVRRPRYETAVGTVRAVHEASVASRLLAAVDEVKVTAGQAVTEGDVLVRLDDADLQARLKQAEAAAASAQATLARAQVDHERAVRLIADRAIARSEFDQAVAALRTAEAEVERSSRAVEESQVLLDFATVKAPFSGIVVDKRVEPGDTATPGQVLVTLYQPERMQLVATVRESLALRLKVGDIVPAKLDAIEHGCSATVSEIVPEAQTASRSFNVKVTGPCPPGAYSGMFGRISIPLDEEEVLVVPPAALFRVGQLDMVRVVEDGRTRRRSVRLGRTMDEGVEVLSGLRSGEQVVVPRDSERRGEERGEGAA